MLKKTFKIFLFILVCCSFVFISNKITIPKTRNYKIKQDFNRIEENSLDFIVFGSCHAYTSINPEIIYEKSGYKGYNYSLPSSLIYTSYLQLVDALETQSPKIVFIETWGVNAESTYITPSFINAYEIEIMSMFKNSKEKIDVINDYYSSDNPLMEILDISESDKFKGKTSLLLPFIRYKERLLYDEGLEEVDFNDDYIYTQSEIDEDWVIKDIYVRTRNKGFLPNSADSDYDTSKIYNPIETIEKKPLSKIDKKYINKIIDLCKKKNIEIVFYTAPYEMNKEEVERLNELSDFLKSKHVDYLDLNKLIEFYTSGDFYDVNHLNVHGADKATLYLNEYLEKKYSE